MEAAIVLLVFSGFLVFVMYRMDQNEHKNDHEKNSYRDMLRDVYEEGFKAGRDWDNQQFIDCPPKTKSLRKWRK